LDEVNDMWFHEYGPWHFQKIAEHYGIYKDLFDGDFFVPVVNIDINYEFDGQYINPVIRGNRLTPTEVAFILLAIIYFGIFLSIFAFTRSVSNHKFHSKLLREVFGRLS
jgi:hypothetical protein